ncbi:glycosyltransferase family 2 protein [Methyloceanibacter sp.]|uniref:glycosyltransferase family 2 protein n=1 Tax=Methyloceanibacter sp. TaxID=1965321 RepID=UPI003D6D1775
MVESSAAWVRVIIVNHNAGPLLQNCIDALAAQTVADFEAFVVDNDSTDGSATALRLPDDRFRLHLAHANLGFAAANNLAAADGKAPWVATLNPDAIAGKTWLEELRSATLRHPGVRMFGSTQLDARKPDRVDGFGDVYSVFGTAWRGASGSPAGALPPDDREVFAPCAASALYARDAYLAAGGFDESFFCYLEDVDLGFRLRLRGERCVQVRRAEVKHFGSVSAGEDSDFFVFHSQRNRLWVLAKNVPSPLIWLVAALQIVVVPLTVLRRGRGKWRTAFKGVAAGLRGFPAAWRRRRDVQSERMVSSRDMARMLVWDPRKALRHAPQFMTARSPRASQAAKEV